MRRQKKYNFDQLGRIEKYVRSHFPNITGSAAHCYFLALPYLERIQGTSCGGWFFASYDNWARASYRTRKTVMKALKELNKKGFIDLIPGDSSKRLATKVRRRTISEIKTMVSREIRNKYVPENADHLAEKLQKLDTWWDGKRIYPKFTARKTGRIYMSRPNLQSKAEKDRWQKLKASLQPSEKLVCCDYSQAEPTVLWHALQQQKLMDGKTFPKDIYNDLASLISKPRQEAKAELLKLFYSRYSEITIPRDWNIPEHHYLHKLVAAVNEYRNRLWEGGKPQNKTPRHVHTLLGRKVLSEPRERVHRGKILSWHIQGTISDLFNEALNNILKEHDKGHLRFLLQVHDCVYAAMKQKSGKQLKTMMEAPGQKKGIGINTKTKEYKRGSKEREEA